MFRSLPCHFSAMGDFSLASSVRGRHFPLGKSRAFSSVQHSCVGRWPGQARPQRGKGQTEGLRPRLARPARPPCQRRWTWQSALLCSFLCISALEHGRVEKSFSVLAVRGGRLRAGSGHLAFASQVGACVFQSWSQFRPEQPLAGVVVARRSPGSSCGRDLDCVPGPQLRHDPASASAGIWGVNQHVGVPALSILSVFPASQINCFETLCVARWRDPDSASLGLVRGLPQAFGSPALALGAAALCTSPACSGSGSGSVGTGPVAPLVSQRLCHTALSPSPSGGRLGGFLLGCKAPR